MKRFFLLILSIWKQQLKLYVYAALIGAVIGMLVLAPSNDFIEMQTLSEGKISALGYILTQSKALFQGDISIQRDYLLFYAEIGALLGLMSFAIYGFIHRRLHRIELLKHELDKDLLSIIEQGEGPWLEFKSSLRWDIEQSRVNRTLESVVLKTLAGFMNSARGGTLLIGVSDDGAILGLQQDFQSLKKPNQDGFEQALMTAVSSNLGADLCRHLHILFHVRDGKQVCRVIVSPAHRPVFLSQGKTPKFFLRTGGSTRDLNVQEALDFVQSRWKQKAIPIDSG
ncbi:RNA-binding domain-containing protein [Methylomarinum sp. Ch1-1]|uniref:RNA-binding domain-containing protein n=1 Tax=Methylomarinum roseum TaxID=3067653 RepID=A0AAU7NUS3_9GAMM|nr:RNA-binding domain-containing protein [Methylomarinum sp. Ch1-1]MDP4519171.1 putative DNA binding domain-containing protein [Methylomarinum sp. Ch1-1]